MSSAGALPSTATIKLDEKQPVCPKEASSRLRGMKFMQKKEEAKVRRNLEAAQQEQMREWQWVAAADSLPETLQVEALARIEHAKKHNDVDYAALDTSQHQDTDIPGEQLFARRSFMGFNPVVEKLVDQLKEQMDYAGKSKKKKAKAPVIADTVTEEEMAQRYAQLIHGDKKKRHKKKRRQE